LKGTGNFFEKMFSFAGKAVKGLLTLFVLGTLVAAIWGDSSSNRYKVIGGTDDSSQIAVIDLNGVIMSGADNSNPFGETGGITPDHLESIFNEIKQNDKLKGIILRINSPGGSVTASEEIYQMIKNYRASLNVPIWAVYSEVAASGGYYISLASDRIYAPETTLTGSIGVILQTVNFNELAQKYGVKSVTIKSGENKNLLDPFEPVNEGQVALLQGIVDESYQIFLNRIVESRKLGIETVKPIADGRVLSGIQAKNFGLVDELGYYPKAADDLVKLLGLTDPQFIQYGQKSFLESLLMGLSNRIGLKQIELDLLPESRFHGVPAYLYM